MREAAVSVHVVALDEMPAEESAWVLDADERSRADRFIVPGHRQRYIAAHAALRLVLEAETGMSAPSLRFGSGRHGKPYLEDAPDLGFNLSHSGNHALVAVSHGHAVGVDLEAVRLDVEPDALGSRFFSDCEQAELSALPAGQRVDGFFNAWTRKEAYLKGRGEGIAFGLDHFDVTLAPRASDALRVDRRDPAAARSWLVTDLPAPPGFVAALALKGATPSVTCYNFPSRRTL